MHYTGVNTLRVLIFSSSFHPNVWDWWNILHYTGDSRATPGQHFSVGQRSLDRPHTLPPEPSSFLSVPLAHREELAPRQVCNEDVPLWKTKQKLKHGGTQHLKHFWKIEKMCRQLSHQQDAVIQALFIAQIMCPIPCGGQLYRLLLTLRF